MTDRRTLLAAGAALAGAAALPARAARPRHRGLNLTETAAAPFGSAAAARALRDIAATGATTVAIVPFLWQRAADSADIVLGDALPPERIARGIAQARVAGLDAVVKPHVWVPGGWAGQVAMRTDADWRRWFAAYAAAVVPLAALAARGGATTFVVGTELRESIAQGGWRDVIAAVRAVFPRRLVYVAHGADEAERVPFWRALDAVGVSLYPPLGRDDAPADWTRAMRAEAGRAARVAARAGRPLWVGEIGLRSAAGAAQRPWESAEERAAPPAPALQAAVLAQWLAVLEGADTLLVWRAFTDPAAGGVRDTDFTVQNKPAMRTLRDAWR